MEAGSFLGCDNAFWQRETSFRWGWSLSPRLFLPCLDSGCACFGSSDRGTSTAALSASLGQKIRKPVPQHCPCVRLSPLEGLCCPPALAVLSTVTQMACPPLCSEWPNQPSFGLGFKTSNGEHGPFLVPYHLHTNTTTACKMNGVLHNSCFAKVGESN